MFKCRKKKITERQVSKTRDYLRKQQRILKYSLELEGWQSDNTNESQNSKFTNICQLILANTRIKTTFW